MHINIYVSISFCCCFFFDASLYYILYRATHNLISIYSFSCFSEDRIKRLFKLYFLNYHGDTYTH